MKNSSLFIKHKRNLIFCLLLSMANTLSTQNETTNWYFGNGELSFTASPPIATFNSSMLAPKGCASLSDSNGNLLFYTQGDTIWNSSHQVMSNGAGLNGNIFCPQSALIMKKPGSQNLFYVFSQNGSYGNLGVYMQKGLRYAIVDMSLAAGQGSVTVKNVPIDTSALLRNLAGTNHCNGQDAWIMTHELNNNKFKAYLLTSAGLNTLAVESAVGQSGIYANVGQMKFSPNGKKLAYCSAYSFEVFDFDNSNGIVSNHLSLNSNFYSAGCEFSPDGTKFYGTAANYGALPSRLFQWNLCAGTNSAISSSRFEFSHIHAETFGTMQLAKDGKIYIGGVFYTLGMYTGNGLAVIQSPNSNGANCNPVIDTTALYAFVVGGGALPNFSSSFFNPPLSTPSFSIAYHTNCAAVHFSLAQSLPAYGCVGSGNRVNAVVWDFGEPSSGAANTSTLLQTNHNYSAVGNYMVRAILTHDCRVDTLYQTININHLTPPNISISGTQYMCSGEMALLSASGADTYTWNTGSNTAILSVSLNTTQYFAVSGTNSLTQCYSQASHTVNVSQCLGVVQQFSEAGFRYFPNPVNDVLYIEMEDSSHYDLIVFDALGKVVMEVKRHKSASELSITDLKAGVYVLKLQFGDQQKTGRFVKL